MRFRSLAALALAVLLAVPALGQTAGWHLADRDADGIPGISLARAYELLQGRTPQREVVVAILDSGVDIEHPDLAPVLWTNADEVPGNGADDDGNGYADDVVGWSFLGNPSGENVDYDSWEIARLVAACRRDSSDPLVASYDCPALERDLEAERAQYEPQLNFLRQLLPQMQQAEARLVERFGDDYDPDNPGSVDVGMDPQLRQAQGMLSQLAAQGATVGDLEEAVDQLTAIVDYKLNPEFDPRDIVGDNYADLREIGYGNGDVAGPDPSHGTGVAGLVAAMRDNGTGIDGVAPNTPDAVWVRIMPVRTVPSGDERDKDVANAIRYAVDNGAHIINMSFGKAYSPHQDVVDEAIAYAAANGVLLVHASGNDGADIDEGDNYPTRFARNGSEAGSWLEVGASADDLAALAAGFSNYGRQRVDLFAPGQGVTSLEPGGGTFTADGTSFAAPVVAGVAALLMAYFPELTAADVRDLLMETAVRYEARMPRPGGAGSGAFTELSVSGGVVNAAAAVEAALQR